MIEASGRESGSGESKRRSKAYETVATELRRRIVVGELAQGGRLPNEHALADEFGVSRTTIREALRLLASQDLIRTAKGAKGGSYVTLPRASDVEEYLESTIDLLTMTQRVTLDDLLVARKIVEVPATRLAAANRREDDVARLRSTLPEDRAPWDESKDFHTILIGACANSLISFAVVPIFAILARHVDGSKLPTRFHKLMSRQHIEITDAIDRGDVDAAGDLMEEHLESLRPYYERAWDPPRLTSESQ
jgi:GntR family transcriptional repressor for pyruvate dehydrogenase complex